MKSSLTMKTQDKRQFVELREHLHAQGARSELSLQELRAQVEPVLGELGRMCAEVTQRMLTAHNRAVWATWVTDGAGVNAPVPLLARIGAGGV